MEKKERKVGFIGLGYAGFPMACLFSKKYDVVGFDLSRRRVAELNSGVDHCGDVPDSDIQEMLEKGTIITNNISELKDCNFFIVAVPTPVDRYNKPDLSYLTVASREVGSVLKKGDIVVFESTVYPGATESVCVPELEKVSGLKYNEDFFVGYSPERINPGDKIHRVDNTVKVTSGSTPETAKIVNDTYAEVLGKDNTYSVSAIKVAEACKVVENTQRDINIAFINETSKVLNAMGIDTNEVIDAMNTKWNALGFRPGLVGGHCIGVDPYYLIDKAKEHNVNTKLMQTARRINNGMSDYIVDKVVRKLKERNGDDLSKTKILLLGFSFKENCPDVRNTKIFDVYKEFLQYTPNVTIYDPVVDSELVRNLYGITIATSIRQIENEKYDAVVLCVSHDLFKDLDACGLCTNNGFVYDIKGFYPKSCCNKEAVYERI